MRVAFSNPKLLPINLKIDRVEREIFDAATGRIWPAVLDSLENLRKHLDMDVQAGLHKPLDAGGRNDRSM